MRAFGLGSGVRELMNTALQVTVHDGDRMAVTDILKFCLARRIILFIPFTTM